MKRSYHTTIRQRRLRRAMVLSGTSRHQRRCPFLARTQEANLALLVNAVIKKRTLCLSELAQPYPTPEKRRVPATEHDLLHRMKRLWRFTNNERVDALQVQMALVPHTIA